MSNFTFQVLTVFRRLPVPAIFVIAKPYGPAAPKAANSPGLLSIAVAAKAMQAGKKSLLRKPMRLGTGTGRRWESAVGRNAGGPCAIQAGGTPAPQGLPQMQLDGGGFFKTQATVGWFCF